MRRFHTAPLVGLQQALCTHAAVTGRFYSRPSPVSSFQLGSYKHAVSPSQLAPPAGSLKGCLRGPLRHSFWAAPRGLYSIWHHFTIVSGKRSSINFCGTQRGMMRPPPGGLPVSHRLGQRTWPRFACRRAGGGTQLSRKNCVSARSSWGSPPQTRYLLLGPPRPQTPGSLLYAQK